MPEKMITAVSPHFKSKVTIQKIMLLVLIALLPAAGAGVYYFGLHALWVILISVVSAVLTEFVIQKLRKQPMTINDLSAGVTGLLLALVIPPGVPLWMPVIGSVFAISLAKIIFGGLGQNIFNPALAGRAFLALSWSAYMTTYYGPDGVTGATPMGILKEKGYAALVNSFGSQSNLYQAMFLGNHGGSIGETSAIALLIGALLLFIFKVIDWRIPATYIGTVAVLALVFRQNVLVHVLGGGLLIGAFFMATDYVTSPITKMGRIYFGIGCGLLTMIIRMFGSYPEGVMFSILLMNTAAPIIDRYTKPKPFGYVKKVKK
jgi:electron transport complex protein RnfD